MADFVAQDRTSFRAGSPVLGSFRPSERRALAVWLMAGLAALLFYIATYDRVDHEAATDLKVGREEAVTRSKEILEQQGFDVSGYRHAITFRSNPTASKFIEKESGSCDSPDTLRGAIRTWYWYVRWFIPSQEEEFGVGLYPDGGLARLIHHLPENAPGATLDTEQARGLAEAFLDHTVGIDRALYSPMADEVEKLPQRSTHTFTWEKTGFDLKGAKRRVTVEIDGDRVGYYSRYLHVPETWINEEDRKDSQRQFLTTVGTVITVALNLAMLIVLGLSIRSRELRLFFAVVVTLILVTVDTSSWLNSVSSTWMRYRTTDSVSAHYVDLMARFVLGQTKFLLGLLLVAIVSAFLGQRVFPCHLPVSRLLTPSFWTSRKLFVAVVVGLCLSMLHAAYYGAFYLLGRKIGVWCPIVPPPLNALGTPFPWLIPLDIGLSAAFGEELLYRLFAISLLLRLTGRRWIAVTVPAIAWSLLHSAYPQEPVYIRCLELTVVGIVYGLVFMRYGIVATIVSHYTYNTLGWCGAMMKTGQPYLAIPALAVACLMVLLLLPSLKRILLRQPLSSLWDVIQAPERSFRWKRKTRRAEAPKFPEAFQPLPLSRTFALFGIGVVLFVGIHSAARKEKPGDFVRVSINRWQAQTIADTYLADRNVPVQGFRRVVWFGDSISGEHADYLWQKEGVSGLNRVLKERHLFTRWAWVSYFKPLQIEEYTVGIAPDGTVGYYSHDIEETAPGARLSKEEALRIAERHVREQNGINLDAYALVDSSSKELESRTDHRFTWEDTTEKVGDATFRVFVKVQGDEPVAFQSFVKVPDEWSREREKRGLREAVAGILAAVLGIAFAIFLGFVLYDLIHSHLVSFRIVAVTGISMFLCAVLKAVNSLGTFWSDYDSSSSPTAFAVSTALEWFLLRPVGLALIGAFLVMLADGLMRRVFPERHPLGYWFGLERLYRDRDRVYAPYPRLPIGRVWGEAILIVFLLCALDLTSDLAVFDHDLASNKAPSIQESAPDSTTIGGYNPYIPAADVFFVAVFGVIVGGLSFLTAGLLIFGYFRSWKWLIAAVMFLPVFYVLDEAETLADGVSKYGEAVLGLILVAIILYMIVRYVTRGNIPVYFTVISMTGMLSEGMDMVRVPEPYTKANGIFLLAIVVLLAVIGTALCLRARSGNANGITGNADALGSGPPPPDDAESAV